MTEPSFCGLHHYFSQRDDNIPHRRNEDIVIVYVQTTQEEKLFWQNSFVSISEKFQDEN